MLIQELVDTPVQTPDVVWSALAPVIALAVGAILLIMFRSVVKRMPAEFDSIATIAIGPFTVLSMWIVGGLVGDDVPLSTMAALKYGQLGGVTKCVITEKAPADSPKSVTR